jgi:hypothetical protein
MNGHFMGCMLYMVLCGLEGGLGCPYRQADRHPVPGNLLATNVGGNDESSSCACSDPV